MTLLEWLFWHKLLKMKHLKLFWTVLLLPACLHAGGLSTLTLPTRPDCEGLYFIDIQASYPGVDFANLDRLYIPQGHYSFIRLGNLPDKTAVNPLVITNTGGQVRVGGCAHHYNFVVSGGSHWKLTGEYQLTEATGDAQFVGHANGQYAHSYDQYGILIDAEYGPGNIGLSVAGGSTDFAVSFLEVRKLGFAGMMFKTDNDGNAHMDNVKIHDNYIHDTISEGVYLGSTQSQPQHKFTNLEFYNNRLIRTGTEIGQFGNLGDNSRIHHNVFLLGALEWKNPFQNFQDSSIQLGHREGSMSFDHNIVIGGASNNLIFFNPDVAGDQHTVNDLVNIHDNYFGFSRNIGVYIHSSSDGVKQIEFNNNYFTEVVFSYDELNPGSTNHQRIIRSFNADNPIGLNNNIYEPQAGQSFYAGFSNITDNNNQPSSIDDIPFYQLGWPGSGDYFTMEIWTALDTHGETVTYQAGDLVVHLGSIYEAQRTIDYQVDNQVSPDNALVTDWLLKPPMADDVRQLFNSPFAHIGLLDQVLSDVIFADGFE